MYFYGLTSKTLLTSSQSLSIIIDGIKVGSLFLKYVNKYKSKFVLNRPRIIVMIWFTSFYCQPITDNYEGNRLI